MIMSEKNTVQKASLLTVLVVLSASFVNTIGGIVNPAIASLAAAYPSVGLNTIVLVSTLPMFAAIPTSLLAGKIINKLGAKNALLSSFGLLILAGIAPAFMRADFTAVLVCRSVAGLDRSALLLARAVEGDVLESRHVLPLVVCCVLDYTPLRENSQAGNFSLLVVRSGQGAGGSESAPPVVLIVLLS